jgi:thiol-disulfide isomerase/thioredoxin
MNLPVFKKRALWIFVAAVVALGGYFAHTAWQTQRGEAALKATALEFLPLEQALALAKVQGQPVLVDFSAIWCPTCRVLHAEVFTNATVKEAITTGFVLSPCQFGLELGNTLVALVERPPDIIGLEAQRDVLRAIPVEAFNPDSHLALRSPFADGLANRQSAEDLQALPVRVVDQDQSQAIVVHQVTDADELPVARHIGEGQGLGVDDLQEARAAAAVLHIGPARFRFGGPVEAALVLDERRFVRSDLGVAGLAIGLESPDVLRAAAVPGLGFAHGGGVLQMASVTSRLSSKTCTWAASLSKVSSN